ncbi:MAG: NADH-quinone oxidoreductase subunit NuoH [Acidobacteriota bacterium]|nr:NADH-quinone oxidoreductase subunit NuoH [Acidobacteriota bacterium]
MNTLALFAMNMFALFAPPNFIDDLLLKLFSRETVNFVVWPFIQIGAVITLVAVWALYASYLERKISAFMQARLGPMRVGKWGLLQPIADAVKLLTKEDLMPENADPYIFRYAPYISVAATFLTFSVIPFAPNWGVITDVNIGLLFVLSISSVGVLALILAGWSSNSKYALLGGLRSSAQMVSYEVAMGLSLIGSLMFARTLSLSGIVGAQAADGPWPYLIYQPLAFGIFFISGIAENNRAPFDLPEAESELVAGFHTEYSGMRWSLFFMAEYAAMVVVSAVATTVFLGGWYFPGVLRLTGGYGNLYIFLSLVVFIVKCGVLLYLYFWFRWTFPRYRYDQLMDLGWKWLIPASILNVVWTALTIFTVQALDGWRGLSTIEPFKGASGLSHGLNLTWTGKAVAIVFGWAGLLVAALFLAALNWRSRDFNLKKQRRQVRLVDVPKGKPAVATTAATEG